MMKPTSPSGPLRRHAAKIALVALLSIPAIAGALHAAADRRGENRVLASLPDRPTDWASALALPPKLDAWINDNFGFRARLLRAHNRLRYRLFHEFPSIQMTAGRHGRVFLTAHGLNVPPFSAVTAVCAGDAVVRAGTPAYINRLFRDFHAQGLDPRMLIVPSGPVVEYQDLPRWISDRCAATDTPMAKLLAGDELDPLVRQSTLYPLKEMREISRRQMVFPKHWFHWNGPGLDEVAQLTLPMWGKPLGAPAPALGVVTTQFRSDVHNLIEGIDLTNTVQEADFAGSGVESCYGGRCFPEFKEYAETLYDISRFHNPKAPKRRLVMLTDSFGSKISGWYARYYSDVEQVATNNISQLSTDQIRRLKEYLFRDRENMDLLILYHDGGATTGTLQYGLERFHEKP